MADKKAVFYVEPQVLVGIRKHSGQITSQKNNIIRESSRQLRLKNLQNVLIEKGMVKLADGIMESFNMTLTKGMNIDEFFRFFCNLIK